MPVRILSIEPDSLASRLALQAGDRILKINGAPIQDVLDLQYQLAGEDLQMQVERGEQRVEVQLDGGGEPLGAEVEPIQTKICANDCLFCFIDQLPPGSRPTLQIRDDDFRLSFLHGNYITLSNLNEREIERIIEQRLTPLYVSVHATDMQVRTLLLGRRKEAVFWPIFERLLQGGIRLNCQVVICPGINDGPVLRRTIFDLLKYFPGVQSIAIVPLGLSDHPAEKMKLLTPVTDKFCQRVVDEVQVYQREIRASTGKTFAYLADEFYLRAARAVPAVSHYDGFPQLEDGIGMARLFSRDFQVGLRRLFGRPLPALRGQRATLATGTLFAPVLNRLIGRFNRQTGARWEVLPVENFFLGSGITVAGLMAGADIVRAARGTVVGDFLLVSSEALANDRRLFLDDQSLDQVAAGLGLPVLEGGFSSADFFERLPGLSCGSRVAGCEQPTSPRGTRGPVATRYQEE